MEEFIESLKKIKLSNRTEERLKRFDEKIHQIYRTLKQPWPSFEKQRIIGGNSIKFIEQQKELHQVFKNGVIVGRIYQVINPSEPQTDDKNLEFQGSCFLATANIAVCCSHQVVEKKEYILRIDGRLFKDKIQHHIKVKRMLKNSIEKKRPGQTKSEDYAFLVLETDKTLKKTLEDYLADTKVTTLEGIKDSMFYFDAAIYGYFEKVPKQFLQVKQWTAWSPKDLIKSSGTAEYNNKELSYTVSTEFGFSGAPIVLVYQGRHHIVGLHTRESHFHSKNYGLLFNKTFFVYLQRVINEFQLEEEDNKCLQQRLNIFPLASIVEYKTTLKEKLKTQPDIDFIGKALEKIILIVEEFEDSELVVEQLKLQDIIISKEYKDDFVLDFSRLRLSELVQKGSLDQSNLHCISKMIYEIESMIRLPLKLAPKFLTPEQLQLEEEKNAFENKNDQKEPLIIIIKRCLADSFITPWVYGSKLVKILLNKIAYAKTNYEVNQYLEQSSPYPMNQILEPKIERDLLQIIQMTSFKLNQNIFRKKFCLLIKYSQERLSDSVIARTYLVKLSSFYKQFQKVIELLIWLTANQGIVYNSSSQTQIDFVYRFQLKLLRLKDLQMFSNAPNFTLLYKNFINRKGKDKLGVQNTIKSTYESMLRSKQITFSQDEIDNLVKHQYIFCRTYFQCFQDLIDEMDSFKQDKKIIWMIKTLRPQIWQKKSLQVLKQPPQPLKKKELGSKPFAINETKIFQEVFIDYEHTVFNKPTYEIIDMTPEQERQYEEILNILVQIRDKEGISKGTGFFLGKDTVCTARHIFEGQDLSRFLIVNTKLKLQCTINTALTSFDNNVSSKDIIFLKVRVRFYMDGDEGNLKEKPYFSKNIYMLDSDIQDPKQFDGKSYFGLLMGLRRVEGSNQIRPTKSYGQIQMHRTFHPLIGERHLSGSPIFLRIAKEKEKEEIEYQYAIIGIYSGIESGPSRFSAMQRFRAKSFDVQGSFLQNIEFPRLSKCIYQITDQLKQCIIKIYSSLDHFLLSVMGQVMRLNSLSIYLKNLTINNIIFADNLPTDIVFSRLPINVHLQCGKITQKMFETKKLELQAQNKSAFAEFITGLLADQTHAIFNKSDFVRQSVLVDQLDLLNNSTSLTQYYTTCLQGKYYFDKESCTLKPNQNSKQEITHYQPQLLPQESKFEMLFKRMPAEHFARINLGYSLLKNSYYKLDDLKIDNRGAILEQQVYRDLRLLQRYAKQEIDCNQFYFLAKKLIRDGVEETLIQYKKKKLLTQGDQRQEFEKFKGKFMSYLQHLTSFSNLSFSMLTDFINQHQRKVHLYFLESKNWSLISEILNLYNSFQV